MTSRSPLSVLRTARLALLVTACSLTAQAQTDLSIDPAALQQIRQLLQEKEARTPTQQKLGSVLVYASMAASGAVTPQGAMDSDGTRNLDEVAGPGILVDIHAQVSPGLTNAIGQAGGLVISASSRLQQLRARVPASILTALASRSDVQSIRPGTRRRVLGFGKARSPLAMRGAATMPSWLGLVNRMGLNFFIGSLTSQGYITHAANTAISTYGANGSGVKVGVLSDSAEYIPFLIGTGDLPVGALNVADIIAGPGTSEGSAMMEIVYDLAPGSQLFFASGFNGPADFADNIRLLRNTYGCDVIVDDVSYSGETPFQDGIIAQAVNDVTLAGATYFSSAGNSGNLTNGNSTTWEGDFVSAGSIALLPGYTIHNFGSQAFNRILSANAVVDLFWSDPNGASTNDYDLFVLNAAGTAVLASSTGLQTGSEDPFEEVYNPSGFPANARIVIAAKAGAAPRALHLETFGGARLQIATAGSTHGHNAAASAAGVAAVYWNSARTGTRPFVGGPANTTEVFSSDGPRKIFFNANGTAITPGNFLFGTNGGVTLVKPDISAADGVTTRTPGFSPFFGTSAAAPHAAGIAALIKSAKPSLTNAQILNSMTTTTLDIRAVGVDRDSGNGIVMAPAAINKALQ